MESKTTLCDGVYLERYCIALRIIIIRQRSGDVKKTIWLLSCLIDVDAVGKADFSDDCMKY